MCRLRFSHVAQATALLCQHSSECPSLNGHSFADGDKPRNCDGALWSHPYKCAAQEFAQCFPWLVFERIEAK